MGDFGIGLPPIGVPPSPGPGVGVMGSGSPPGLGSGGSCEKLAVDVAKKRAAMRNCFVFILLVFNC